MVNENDTAGTVLFVFLSAEHSGDGSFCVPECNTAGTIHGSFCVPECTAGTIHGSFCVPECTTGTGTYLVPE